VPARTDHHAEDDRRQRFLCQRMVVFTHFPRQPRPPERRSSTADIIVHSFWFDTFIVNDYLPFVIWNNGLDSK